MANDIEALLARVLRHWWLVLLIALAMVSIVGWQQIPGDNRFQAWQCVVVERSEACRASLQRAVRFRASSRLVVAPDPDLSTADLPRVVSLLNNPVVIATYVDVLESSSIVDRTIDTINIPTAERGDYRIHVIQLPDSNVLEMTVEGPDRAKTEQLSQAMRTTAPRLMGELYPLYALHSLDARTSTQIIESDWSSEAGIAVVVGVGLGILVALWYDIILMAYRKRKSLPRKPRIVDEDYRAARTTQVLVTPEHVAPRGSETRPNVGTHNDKDDGKSSGFDGRL